MDRRRRLLVNEGEIRTDEALREVAADVGYRVFPKVRVADALAIDHSGLPAEAYSYALRSHFDWLVADTETSRPEFAVEFDGESHETPAARRRDALKVDICARLGLPLLRIDRAAYRPTTRRTVIGYAVEAWAAYQAFTAAQETGQIPEDEIFEPWMTIDINEDGTFSFRDIAAPSRRLVYRLHEAGLLTEWGPTDASRGPSADDPEHAEGYAWVTTVDGHLVVGHARLRTYSFPAVRSDELAEDIAHLDLAGQLSRLTEGDRSVLVEPSAIVLPEIGTAAGWSGGWCQMTPPAA
jgi:hypothetical protein